MNQISENNFNGNNKNIKVNFENNLIRSDILNNILFNLNNIYSNKNNSQLFESLNNKILENLLKYTNNEINSNHSINGICEEKHSLFHKNLNLEKLNSLNSSPSTINNKKKHKIISNDKNYTKLKQDYIYDTENDNKIKITPREILDITNNVNFLNPEPDIYKNNIFLEEMLQKNFMNFVQENNQIKNNKTNLITDENKISVNFSFYFKNLIQEILSKNNFQQNFLEEPNISINYKNASNNNLLSTQEESIEISNNTQNIKHNKISQSNLLTTNNTKNIKKILIKTKTLFMRRKTLSHKKQKVFNFLLS